jgi:hypothetical protein
LTWQMWTRESKTHLSPPVLDCWKNWETNFT